MGVVSAQTIGLGLSSRRQRFAGGLADLCGSKASILCRSISFLQPAEDVLARKLLEPVYACCDLVQTRKMTPSGKGMA